MAHEILQCEAAIRTSHSLAARIFHSFPFHKWPLVVKYYMTFEGIDNSMYIAIKGYMNGSLQVFPLLDPKVSQSGSFQGLVYQILFACPYVIPPCMIFSYTFTLATSNVACTLQ